MRRFRTVGAAVLVLGVLLSNAAPTSAQIDAEIGDGELQTFFQWFNNTFQPLLPLALLGVGVVAGGIFVAFLVTRLIALIRPRQEATAAATDEAFEAEPNEFSHDAKSLKIKPIEDWELDKLIGPAATAQERKKQVKQERRDAGWIPSWGRPTGRGKRKRGEKDLFADINVFGPEKRGKRGRKDPTPFANASIFEPERRTKRGRQTDSLFAGPTIFDPPRSKRSRRSLNDYNLFAGPSIFEPARPRRRRRR